MRTILFTGWDAKYDPLATLTVPRMGMYATEHWLDFDEVTEPLLNVPNGIYWTGVAGGLKYLREGYERVIYLDVDQMITNPAIPLDVPEFGFHVSKDWGADATELWHFSMCGFVAHRDCIPIFKECLSMEPEWREKPFPEQGPMREVIRKQIGGVDDAVFLHPRRFLNAVPKEVDPTVQEPWQPGDFAAHLTNLPLDKRIELFHEIKKQAGI